VGAAATQQVADWLEKLGLGQYAQRFAENDIDFALLTKLTDANLKDLGVTSVGHRMRLLEAIAKGATEAPLPKLAEPKTADAAPAGYSPPALPIAAPTGIPPMEATGERRHVTVMFCDLVDSTGISAKLDAEEWRDLVGAYLDGASAAVTEMGGKVAKKLGDGLMALFGYPVAQENDAERAVRAALAIQRSLAELNRKNESAGKPALAARIAIDSGPAVLDAGGEIFGDVANIAARAQFTCRRFQGAGRVLRRGQDQSRCRHLVSRNRRLQALRFGPQQEAEHGAEGHRPRCGAEGAVHRQAGSGASQVTAGELEVDAKSYTPRTKAKEPKAAKVNAAKPPKAEVKAPATAASRQRAHVRTRRAA
jgi:class 3 adenylate cyclase